MLHEKGNSKLPWRTAGQPRHLVDVVDSDQWVVNRSLSLSGRCCKARSQRGLIFRRLGPRFITSLKAPEAEGGGGAQKNDKTAWGL